MPLVLQILLPIAVGVVCAVIAFIAGSNHRKHTAEAEIGSAEQEAKRLVNEAIKTAEAKKKETILEGKDEIHRQRLEAEREIADRRKDVQRQERLNKLLPAEIVELRKELKEGMPCPVCGSVHHPLQYADKVQSLQEKELNQAKEEVAGAIGRQEIGIEKRKTDITRLSAVVENYERHISETLDSISTYVSILPGWEASLEQGKLKQQILNFGDQWKKQMEKQTDADPSGESEGGTQRA